MRHYSERRAFLRLNGRLGFWSINQIDICATWPRTERIFVRPFVGQRALKFSVQGYLHKKRTILK